MLALITRGTVLQPARQVPATTAATSSGGIVVILVGAGPGPGCAMFVVVAQLAAFRCIIHVRVSARNEVVAVVVSHVELFAGIVASRRRCGRDTGGKVGPTYVWSGGLPHHCWSFAVGRPWSGPLLCRGGRRACRVNELARRRDWGIGSFACAFLVWEETTGCSVPIVGDVGAIGPSFEVVHICNCAIRHAASPVRVVVRRIL